MVSDKATVRRAGSAIAKREDYQRPLIEQLNQIKTSSDRRIREAELSHVVGTRDAMRRLLEGKLFRSLYQVSEFT